MAIACSNLGGIHSQKGDNAAMCDSWRKARDLYRQLGLSKEAAEAETWLEQNKCGES
jgi:hypothetical protein